MEIQKKYCVLFIRFFDVQIKKKLPLGDGINVCILSLGNGKLS